jgi:hypothetical protein
MNTIAEYNIKQQGKGGYERRRHKAKRKSRHEGT